MVTMILTSKNVSAKVRCLMKDVSKLIDVEEEQKWDFRKNYGGLKHLMEENKCDSIIFFQSTRKADDVWMGILDGMSILFRLYNVFTMRDCNFPVNSFKDCGHVLMFSEEFNECEHLKLVKDVMEHVFRSPEVKDRALCFFYLDNKIWIRNYKIGEKLEEIGPRLVLEVLGIFEHCFCGNVLYRMDRSNKLC